MPIKRINPIYTHREGEPELAPLDASLFSDIAEVAHNLPRDPDYRGVQADVVLFRNGEVLYCQQPSLYAAYMALGEALEQRSEQLHRSRGTHRFAVHSIQDGQLYPEWHIDTPIEDAFSTSPDASTIGISGDVAVQPGETIDAALERLSASGELLAGNRELIVPPASMYVAIPNNAPHISPQFSDDRLLIVGNVMPNFLANQFVSSLQAYERVVATV